MPTPSSKYRVVSDGTTHGTYVIDPQGNRIGCLTGIKIAIDVTSPTPEVLLELRIPAVEVDVETDSVTFCDE